MTETKKVVGNPHYLVGDGVYWQLTRVPIGMLAISTRRFKEFTRAILPEPAIHRMKTPVTMGKFYDEISRRWWNRTDGDHISGFFNEELFNKILIRYYGEE